MRYERVQRNTTFTKQAIDHLKFHQPSATVKLAKKDIESQLEDKCVETYVDNAIIVTDLFHQIALLSNLTVMHF